MTLKKNLCAIVLAAAIIALPAMVCADDNKAEPALHKADVDDRISYAIGYDLTNRLKDSFTINPDLFLKGMTDSLAGETSMTPEKMQETLAEFQAMAQQKQMEAQGKKAAANKADGEAFLDENKTKEGVTTLASGLQYKVITPGTGQSPDLNDKVKCHYRGSLINGREFDSSYQRNEPAVFPVNGVIKGWTEALQLMKVGAKWMLYVPADLAYGDQGAGNVIEPGSTLIFEVELLEIQKI
ncbi:MAG: FKBP-type peptidyl-prolyl cis-trans isomerase [Desulfobacteraceae bacterium]|nr:FKBP-type peptidyl-prolyl cis-trans isomerase [Desulfobacteraceae bacterium]